MRPTRSTWIEHLRAHPVIRPGAHYVRTTTRCNNNCRFCNVDKSVEIPPAEVEELIARIPADTREVVLTGGEPTIDPQFFGHLERVRARTDAAITLQTNALMFYYGKFLRQVERAGVQRLVISLPAHVPETYRALTGGDPAILRAALDNLKTSALEVVLNCLVTSASHAQLPDLAEWLVESFGDRFGVYISTLIPAAAVRENPELLVRHSEVVPHLAAAAARLRTARVPLTIAGMYGLPPCLLDPELAEASETLLYGNPNVHGETREDEFVRADACATCRYGRICLGVWDFYAERFGTAELQAVDPGAQQLPRLDPGPDAVTVGRYREVLDRFERGLSLPGNFLVWSVTGECNCACTMCAQVRTGASVRDHFSPAELERILADLQGLGFSQILFCGGEPTLVPEMAELIALAKAHGFQAFLNTNGAALAPVLDEYHTAGLDCAILSLDSPDAATHDRLRNRDGLFDAVTAAAAEMSRLAGPAAVRFHTVVLRDTVADVAGMVEVAARCGVGGLDLTLIFDAQGRDNQALRPTQEQLEVFFHQTLPAMAEAAREARIKLHLCPTPLPLLAAGEDLATWGEVLRAPPAELAAEIAAFARGEYNALYLAAHRCASCYRNLTLEHDGTVYPCARSTVLVTEHALGNVKDTPLAELLDSDAFREFRRRAPDHAACRGCFSPSHETAAYDRLLSDPGPLLALLGGRRPG